MSEQTQRFYEFGAFLLDAQERLLFRDGAPVDLTPKVFDILLELVQKSGQVVEKRELMEKVWPDSFVEEGNLTQTVFMLRKALGETPAQPYIKTVPGRGYRFTIKVNKVSANGHAPTAAPILSALIQSGFVHSYIFHADPTLLREAINNDRPVVVWIPSTVVSSRTSRPAVGTRARWRRGSA